MGGMEPGPDAPDDGAESIGAKPHSAESMWACTRSLSEPHILLDKIILRKTDCDPHRVARELATAAQGYGAVISATEEEKDRNGYDYYNTPWPLARCCTTQST